MKSGDGEKRERENKTTRALISSIRSKSDLPYSSTHFSCSQKGQNSKHNFLTQPNEKIWIYYQLWHEFSADAIPDISYTFLMSSI